MCVKQDSNAARKEEKNKMTFHQSQCRCSHQSSLSYVCSHRPLSPLLLPHVASSIPASYAQWRKVRGQTCSLSYSYIMILPFYTLSRTLSRPLGPCISGIIQLRTRTVAWCFMLRYNINVFVGWLACVGKMDVVI